MRRGSFFPRRSATRSSTDSAAWLNDLLADRSAFAPFSGAPGVQLRARSLRRFAPLVGRRFRVSAMPGPRAVRLACPSPDRFRRANSAALCCASTDARQTRRIEDMADRGFRASLPSRVRLIMATSRTMGRSCLGLCPLAGFRTHSLIAMGTSRCKRAIPWSRHRG